MLGKIGEDMLCCKGQMEEARRLHLLMFPFLLPSHVNGLLELARNLASQGCSITFIQPYKDFQKQKPTLEYEQIRFVSLPDTAKLDACATGSKGNQGLGEIMDAMLLMQLPFEELLQELIKSENPVNYIVSDFMIEWMTNSLQKFKLPTAQFWAGSAACLLFLLRMPEFMKQVRFPITADDMRQNEEAIKYTEGILPLKLEDIPLVFHGDPPFPGYYEKVHGGTKEAFEAAGLILINTSEELEKDVMISMQIEAKNVLPIGPILAKQNSPSEHEEDASRCIEWLENQADNSVLYVAFGTVAGLSEDKIQGLATELELSGQPFLFALGPNINKSIPQKTKQLLMDHGLLVNWAPQQQVLSHRAIGGFLTHCGWNSLLEGLTAGVPMLGWPCLFEQNLNCKYMVDEWGIGLKVGMGSEGEHQVGKVRDAIKTLLVEEEGKKMRLRAQELKQKATSRSCLEHLLNGKHI